MTSGDFLMELLLSDGIFAWLFVNFTLTIPGDWNVHDK